VGMSKTEGEKSNFLPTIYMYLKILRSLFGHFTSFFKIKNLKQNKASNYSLLLKWLNYSFDPLLWSAHDFGLLFQNHIVLVSQHEIWQKIV